VLGGSQQHYVHTEYHQDPSIRSELLGDGHDIRKVCQQWITDILNLIQFNK